MTQESNKSFGEESSKAKEESNEPLTQRPNPPFKSKQAQSTIPQNPLQTGGGTTIQAINADYIYAL